MLPRRHPYLILSVTILGGLLSAPTPAAASSPGSIPDVSEVDAAVLSSRRAISSGRLVVTRRYQDFARGASEETKIASVFDFRDKKKRTREDVTAGGVTTTQAYGDRYYYWYCDGPTTQDGRYALTAKELKYATAQDGHYLHEPLMLMLHPLWYRGAEGMHKESFVGSATRSGARIEAAEWDGERAWKVSHIETKGGGTTSVRYWVLPERDHNVVRMEMGFDNRGVPNECSVQCTLVRVRDAVWFPHTVRFEHVAGGELRKREDLEISILSLNEPVDPLLFEPATMNIAPETQVARVPQDPRGVLKWDGKQMVVTTSAENLRRLSNQSRGDWSIVRFLLLGGSLVCAAVCVIVAWLWHYRRPKVGIGG